MHHAFAVFTIATPWSVPVTQIGDAGSIYPRVPVASGYGATVVLQFVVDSTGRPEMRTLHGLWPASHPRLTGTQGAYYDRFRTAATRSVASARFHPHRVAGCPVSHLVEQPFVFVAPPR